VRALTSDDIVIIDNVEQMLSDPNPVTMSDKLGFLNSVFRSSAKLLVMTSDFDVIRKVYDNGMFPL
jgi:hypothetical protein